MGGKPKPGFWVAVAVVVAALIAFAVYRAGWFGVLERSGLEGISAGPGAKPAPSGKPLEISFYNSSAKRNWINEMVKEFHAGGAAVGNRPIKVTVAHVTSGGSLDDLKDGKIKPDLWSPGDDSWLHLAAMHWRDVKQKTLFDGFTPLVNIPLIVAMWEPMAKALGHPQPIGWRDIAKVAANPQGWAALGHPEWGKFRWGHAHPDANSGFLTIVSEIYAVLGKTQNISTEDLKNPKVINFLREFEGAVEHYGLSNDWIDDLMHAKGPSYLSATVQYENTIIESNAKHKNKPFKMVAVYPREGNFWTQHPVAILKEEWMTPEKEEAARKFIDFLLGKKAQSTAMKMGLRPINREMKLDAPFDDDHGVQPDIGTDKMFQVPDEAVLRRIRDLWEEVKIPATVCLVLDRSGSMNGEPMDNAKLGAVEFIKSMKPRDMLHLTVFNHNVTTLADFCGIRDCGETAADKMKNVFAEGKTSLYDAVHDRYNMLLELRKKDPRRRYALVVLSDGKDTSSRMNRYDFLDALPRGEDFDAPKIYGIAYGAEADRDLLAEISNRTNGRLFTSSTKDIAKTYQEMSANF
ncbi:MAG: VWA domain-containing protein [Thermodesulfobacteriota bacterium]